MKLFGDYYYGAEADQFAFFRVPRVFFTNEIFRNLSTDAKLLYGLLLDRQGLSRKNGWLDEKNRVFIIYTIEQIMEDLGCGNQKATKLLKELEKYGLVQKKRQGLGKANILYVKNFMTIKKDITSNTENEDNKKENTTNSPTLMKKEKTKKIEEMKVESKKTEEDLEEKNIEKTFKSDEKRNEKTENIYRVKNINNNNYEQIIKKNIDFNDLINTKKYERRTKNLVKLMVEICNSKDGFIKINGLNKDLEDVKDIFLKIDKLHFLSVLNNISSINYKITNIKSFMISTIYNSYFVAEDETDNLVSSTMY